MARKEDLIYSMQFKYELIAASRLSSNRTVSLPLSLQWMYWVYEVGRGVARRSL
jgi:hypothetical protein